MNPFGVWNDSEGNLYMERGPLIALGAATVVYWCGDGGTVPPRKERGEYQRVLGPGVSFEGGSGRNIRVATAATGLAAHRWWVPVEPGKWSAILDAALVITRDESTGALELGDGVDVVADGGSFTGASGVASAGTFPTVSFIVIADTPTYRTWQGVEDPDVSLFLEKATGYAFISYGAGVEQAERASGPVDDPAGVYVATPTGETDWNGGSPWTYTVTSAGATTATLTATPYGEATYNASAPFTVDLEREAGNEWTARPVQLTVPNSTVQAGEYLPTGWGVWESTEDGDWTLVVDENGDGILQDDTDVVMTRAAAEGLPFDAAGRWVFTPYGAANYGAAPGTSSGAADAGDFPELEFRLVDVTGTVVTLTGVTDPTKFIVWDTADGDADLYDELGLIATRTSVTSTAHFDGDYTAEPDGEDRYNGGVTWLYTVTTAAGAGFEGQANLGRAKTAEGWLYAIQARDAGTGEATGISGPFWAASVPVSTATEIYRPVAVVGADGVAVQVQTGPMEWVANP